MEKQRFRICWVPHNPHSTPIWVGLHFRPFPSSLIFLRKSLGSEQTVQTFPVIWVSEVWVPGGLWFSRLPTTRQDGRTDSPGAAELGDLWELRHLQAEDFVGDSRVAGFVRGGGQTLQLCGCVRGCWGGFPGGSVVKNLPANAKDTSSIPNLQRSHMPGSN